MTRKRMIATMMATVLGAGGLAYAADAENPILALAKAVELVNDNTIAIADQTNLIAKDTTTVVQQNTAIANQIDCAGDQTGIELVCDAVEAIQQGK